MVHKTTHRGVHSGNTLRAFNSRYSRRYQNQACIVSRVRPELLKKLVSGNGTDDKVPADDKPSRTPQLNNVAVDVALSLNKQSRWLLPSALIRQIQSNDVAQPDLTVSLLERHKLKRPASCISFHSNKGEVRRIQPRNGRYFSFNFPTADGKSRRAYKRERREEVLKQIRANNAGKTQKIVGKKIEVFTELGRAARNLDMGESEVRYEVYYPSPAQSSLSHNPKYIKQDVSVASGDDGEHVLHGKPKKQHRGKQRKRMSVKDLDDCDLPSYQAHYQHDRAPGTDSLEIAQVGDREEITQASDVTVRDTTTDCLLGSLIEKAERLQQMVGVAKTRRSKKSGSKITSSHHQERKSHIMYLSEAQRADYYEAEDSSLSASTALPVAVTPLESTRVLLPNEDVTVASLKDSFGQNYFEAACRPRKFILDITTNVRELLKKQGVQHKVADTTDDALTYLVFIHDGFYDDEHDVYKVLLNSRLREGLLPVQVNTDDAQDLYKGTVINLVSCAVDFAEGFVAELHAQNHFPSYYRVETKGEQLELKHHLGSAEVYVPSLQRIFQMGSSLTDFSLPSLSDMLQEEPVFCDVCYDDVSPLTQDSASATTLLKCKHRVCDSCWSQHIHSRLHQGFVRVTCPGYDCQDEVKVGVLLSEVPLGTVEKVLQRQEEVRIGASLTEKWCPNQSCGRVLHLQSATASGPNSQLQAATVSGPNSQLQAATVSGPNSQLQAATVSGPNSQLQAATASGPNSQLQAATASGPNSQLHSAIASGPNSQLQAATASSPNSQLQAATTSGPNSQLQSATTSGPNSQLQSTTASGPNSQLLQDVVCACGAHVCFQCLSPAHWPASCAQAQDYRHKLATAVFPDREGEVHDDHSVDLEAKQKRELEERKQKVMMVEGKCCPRCTNFVYKEGGCPQMTCRCGQEFCWFCGKAGSSHPDRGKGCVSEYTEKKLTTTIVVHHLELPADEKKEERQKAAAVQRQRVSLMERAAEHRQRRLNGQHGKVVTSMAKAVATAAAKDKTLAQHIVNVCSNTFPASSPPPTTAPVSPALKTPTVIEVVTSFLKRAARSKRELYEVAEYSLVLLKDLPDSLHRRRALRISEDLGAFCTFAQSIFEAWGASPSGQGQEGVKAVMRLAEIQGWINSALASHVATVRKLRGSGLDRQ